MPLLWPSQVQLPGVSHPRVGFWTFKIERKGSVEFHWVRSSNEVELTKGKEEWNRQTQLSTSRLYSFSLSLSILHEVDKRHWGITGTLPASFPVTITFLFILLLMFFHSIPYPCPFFPVTPQAIWEFAVKILRLKILNKENQTGKITQ